jgi:hypothetical protein
MSNLANGTAAKPGGLSEPQERALAVLLEGRAFSAAAQLAGVHRSTLYRWIKEDAAFAAAYNAWQQELAESARARMHAAIHLAVERVIRCMENNQDLSFKVLKEMGILKPRAAGQIDPERVRRHMELEQLELARRLEEAAPPPARRIASHITTAALPVAEPVVQSPAPAETGVVSRETAGENSALK